jgi:hypothetical protein
VQLVVQVKVLDFAIFASLALLSHLFSSGLLLLRGPSTQASCEAKISQVNIIQRQIEATDRQIDQLVYELYRLNDEENRIVAKSSS